MENPKSTSIDLINKWLEIMIIGHDLCPFAKWPYEHDLVRIVTTSSSQSEAVQHLAEAELKMLSDADPAEVETTLMVCEDRSIGLLDWNEVYLDVVDFIEELGYQGVFQAVMFHPDFEYGGEDPKHIVNVTNRSPLPLIHLLREDSITKAVETKDTQSVIQANSAMLDNLGWQGWHDILTKIHGS